MTFKVRILSALICCLQQLISTDLVDSELDSAFFSWLCPPNAEDSYSVAASRRCPGTCLWIFDHPTYRQWTRDGGMLWLQGLGEIFMRCPELVLYNR
jgi:hypothetical protein